MEPRNLFLLGFHGAYQFFACLRLKQFFVYLCCLLTALNGLANHTNLLRKLAALDALAFKLWFAIFHLLKKEAQIVIFLWRISLRQGDVWVFVLLSVVD